MIQLPPPSLPPGAPERQVFKDHSVLHSYQPPPKAKPQVYTPPSDWVGMALDSLAYPYRQDGWIILAGVLLLNFAVTTLLRALGVVVFFGSIVTLLQCIFQFTVANKPNMPDWPDVMDDLHDHISEVAHAALILVMAFLPLALAVYFTTESYLTLPLQLLLLAYGQVYLTLAFISWNITGNVSEGLPHRVLSLMRKTGKDCYPLAVCSLALSLALMLSITLLLIFHVYWLLTVAASILLLLSYACALARLAGLFYLKRFETCDAHVFE
jgi:hypothetical protein